MLNHNSIIRTPEMKDPSVKVRLLAPIFVAGVDCAIDSVVSMALSDAQALRNSSPPSVEIL